MNWGKEALDLYEKNLDKVGKIEYRGEIPYTLLPIYHSTATAQITVTIDENGNFLHGEQVYENDKFTIIPVTEKSGSRTSGKEAHSLCDNLRYLAGDYPLYVEDDGIRFEIYMEQLKKWYESEFCHSKVRAIYHYLQKRSLMHDLIEQKVLKQKEDGALAEKETIQGINQSVAFVRFIVRSFGEPLTESMDECWKDKTLWESHQKYQKSIEREKGLCYLSGKRESISYLQPKKIRNEGDGSKLISANDTDNFTYLGRFATKEEAFAIGYETSQKVHDALKWIIRRQGRTYGTLVFVAWETAEDGAGRLPVRWDSDTEHIISEFEEENEEDEWDTGLEKPEFDTNTIGAELFQKAMSGYDTLQNEKKGVASLKYMVLLGVDAATTGRLAVVEAKKIEETRYLENIRKWHKECWWRHEKWKDGKRIVYYGMVGVKDIADLLFGIENKGSITIVDANSKKLYAEVAKRILPCIWDGQRIPTDYVERAINKASNPLAYKERRNWEQVLALACSMVKKRRKELYKEEWTMAVDKECRERDYLYGRMLAVADRIEYRTFDMDKDRSRITNAKRYMNNFSQRPFETWKVIEENIQPYLNKLPVPERRFYENLLDEIEDNFKNVEEYQKPGRLSGLYLLGFHSQSCALRTYKTEKTEEE